jgi:hypothetical protein
VKVRLRAGGMVQAVECIPRQHEAHAKKFKKKTVCLAEMVKSVQVNNILWQM